MTEFPEPTAPHDTRTDVLLGYLDYFRERVIAKIRSLPPGEWRASRVASGWTPIELAKHLRHVERRWLEWGFEGRPVEDPWADRRDDRWYVAPEESDAAVIAELQRQGETTTAIVRAHALDEVGQPGPRWEGAEPATLERVLLHLLQEYARHLGQLDIVAEQAGGSVGE